MTEQSKSDAARTAERALGLGKMYAMLRFWVRLYGHVALEVFGRFPFAITNPETLFESMLDELLAESNL